MTQSELNQSITHLATEEIERIYGIKSPEQEMLNQMKEVIERWPLVQKLSISLNSKQQQVSTNA